MIKKVIFGISVIVNILLGCVFFYLLPEAMSELGEEYMEQDTLRSDTIVDYLEWERYGTVAFLSRSIRAGAKIGENEEDYYRLGEYAELLFLREIYAGEGNTDREDACTDRAMQIREEMPDYAEIFDRIDRSAADAVVE